MRPREGEPGKKKDYEPYCSTDPWEGHGTPLREQHNYPEKSTSTPDPRHLSTDIQTQAWSFPGQRPGLVSTLVSMSQCREYKVRSKCSHKKCTVSSKHECRQDLNSKMKVLSCLTLVTPWTVACQAPLCMEFPRQEYW